MIVLVLRCMTTKSCWFSGFMVFNATFNNISVISWRSVLLVEETGGPGENQQPTLYLIVMPLK